MEKKNISIDQHLAACPSMARQQILTCSICASPSCLQQACVCAACVCVLMRRKWQRRAGDWQLSTETQTGHIQKPSGGAGADAHALGVQTYILRRVYTFTVCQAARVRRPPKELKGHSGTHRGLRNWFGVAQTHARARRPQGRSFTCTTLKLLSDEGDLVILASSPSVRFTDSHHGHLL